MEALWNLPLRLLTLPESIAHLVMLTAASADSGLDMN